jgi:hypothetical protein
MIFVELPLTKLYHRFDLIAIGFDELDPEGLLELTNLGYLLYD